MVIKTPEFDRKFMNDLKEINVNKYKKPEIRGSYKTKPYGSTISDIDIQVNVKYNETLLDIVANIIKRVGNTSKNFKFINLKLGKYNDFITPWNIDNKGECVFDIDKAYEWFENFKTKKLVPLNIINKIGLKLYSPQLLITDLIDIDNILTPYSKITWNEKDIRNGYIIGKDKIKYNLLDNMKSKIPILQYIYNTDKGELVSIDFALEDYEYKKSHKKNRYIAYYYQDLYDILKTEYKWKIEDEYIDLYSDTIKKIDFINDLKYKISLVERINENKLYDNNFRCFLNNELKNELLYNNIDINKSFSEILDILYDIRNKMLTGTVEYFQQFVKPEYKKDNIYKYIRGKQAQNNINLKDIKDRSSLGIKCPFFTTNKDDFETLTDLSLNLEYDTDKLIQCFYDNAIKSKMNMSDLVSQIKKNNLSIETIDDKVLLKKNGKLLKEFNIKYKDKLQKYILNIIWK
jgi:hypothetical protein